MQILFDDLGDTLTPEYEVEKGKVIQILLSFTSDDPDALTKYVKSKLEKVRCNIVPWRSEEDGRISVGVGYFYTTVDYGKMVYPHWFIDPTIL